MNTTAEIRLLYLWEDLDTDSCRDSLGQVHVNTTAEIRPLYLCEDLDTDSCRDSLGQVRVNTTAENGASVLED